MASTRVHGLRTHALARCVMIAQPAQGACGTAVVFSEEGRAWSS